MGENVEFETGEGWIREGRWFLIWCWKRFVGEGLVRCFFSLNFWIVSHDMNVWVKLGRWEI